MVHKIIKNIQFQLEQLASTYPDFNLNQNGYWIDALEQLDEVTKNTNRQELYLETATSISNTVNSSINLNELLTASIDHIQNLLDFYYVGIFLINETTNCAELKADNSSIENSSLSQLYNLAISPDHTIGGSIKNKQIQITSVGPNTNHFICQAFPKPKIEAVVPLFTRGQTIGALVLQCTYMSRFVYGEAHLLQAIGDQLANAIQNVLLFATADKQLEQLITLYDITLQLESHLDLNALLNAVAQQSVKLLRTDVSIIRLVDEQDQTLTIKAVYNPPKNIELGQTETSNSTLSSKVSQTYQAILANNWPSYAKDQGYTNNTPNTLAILNVPISTYNKVLGTIEVHSLTKSKAFDENNQHILSLLASQAAIIIERTQLLNQVENNRLFLKTVINHVPDPMFIKDKTHTWVEMNQANAIVIGKPQDELIGKSDEYFFSSELSQEFYRRDDEVFVKNEILEYEDKTVWGDGVEHIAYTRLIPIPDSSGQPEYLLGITHDVTERKIHEAAREQYLLETTALYKGSKAISSALSEKQVFDALFEQLFLENPCEIAAFRYHMVRGEPLWAEIRAGWQNKNTPSYPVGTRFYLPETAQAQLLTADEPLFIENIATDSRLSEVERASFAPTAAVSVAILPLNFIGQELGSVLIYFTQLRPFSENTQRFWLAIVEQTKIALSNQLLIQEAAYRATQIETAANVANAASSFLDLNELLNSSVNLIRDRFELYYVGVFLVDKANKWAKLQAGTGKAGQIQLKKKHRLKIGGDSMIGWSIHHQKPRFALDVGREAVHFQNPNLPDTRSEMALPLISRNEVIGALTVQSTEQAAFSTDDITFLRTMANQLASAIENARLYEQAQQEIIDRKRIEDELRLSETKYRELVENANSIIIRINTQGCITFFNEFAQHFFGYTEKEILGKHIVGTIVPKIDTTGQNLAEILDNILQEPEKFTSNENENIRRNGERVWISWANKAIVDNKGNITEILCVGNDSTNRKMAEQETLKRNQELAVLNRVTTSLTSMLDLDSILQVTAREMVEAFKARNCGIALLNPNQTKLTVVTDYSASPDEPSVIELDIPIKNNPTASGVIETGKSLIVNNPQTSELTKPMHEVMRQRNTQSLMVIPLRVRAEVIGTIGIDTTNKDQVFTNEDLRLAETIAAQVAGAVENARLFEQTQATLVDRQQAQEELLKALERTESLYRIGDAVATITNKDAIYQTILAEYLRLINLKWGALALLHKTREYCTIHLIINETQPIQTDIKIPYNYPLFQHLLKTKQPLVIDNLHTHKLTKDNTAIKERLQIKSGLYVPVIVKSKVIGLVIAGSIEKSYSFSQSDIETGQAITDQLSIWLENRQLLAEAQYRSERLQTAAEVSRAASSILEVDTLIKDSVNFIRDRFGFYYVGLFMVDKAKKWAVLQAGTGEAGQIQLNKKHRLKIGGESMIGWSAKNRKARIALDVGEEAVRFKNPILPDTHSEMALPLTSRDEVIGALTVQSVERGAFSQEDVTLLQTMADQLANAIVNARLFKNAALAQQEAEARLQETSALQTLSQKLGGTLEIDDILNIFFEACTKEIGFEYTQLSLIDKQQHRIKAIGVFGTSASNIKQANRYLDSKDIIVNIITMGQTEIITSWDDRFDKETFEAESLASWVRVFTPITLRQENIGLVEAGVNKNTQVSVKDSQIRLLKAFINQTALALDNANRYEASQKRAKREALIKEITTKVRASTDLDTILKTTVKEIGDAVDNKRAYIHLVSSQETNRHNKHNPKVAD